MSLTARWEDDAALVLWPLKLDVSIPAEDNTDLHHLEIVSFLKFLLRSLLPLPETFAGTWNNIIKTVTVYPGYRNITLPMNKLNNVGFDRYLLQVAWPPIVSVSPHPLDPMCLVTIGGRELWGTGLQIYLTNFTSRTETEATLLLTSFEIISKQKN